MTTTAAAAVKYRVHTFPRLPLLWHKLRPPTPPSASASVSPSHLTPLSHTQTHTRHPQPSPSHATHTHKATPPPPPYTPPPHLYGHKASRHEWRLQSLQCLCQPHPHVHPLQCPQGVEPVDGSGPHALAVAGAQDGVKQHVSHVTTPPCTCLGHSVGCGLCVCLGGRAGKGGQGEGKRGEGGCGQCAEQGGHTRKDACKSSVSVCLSCVCKERHIG